MNWINWLNLREAIPQATTPASLGLLPVETVGTWDEATKTVRLPAGYMASVNRAGNIMVRLGLNQVDLPPGWRVDTGAPTPTPTPTPTPLPDGMVELIVMHNTFRASQGKAPLIADDRLMRAAADYAAIMARINLLSHIGPDGSTPWVRMQRAGYVWSQASENIAAGQTSNEQVMDSWENSPGHRADMLGPYKNIGVGRAGNPPFWVADFASPR